MNHIIHCFKLVLVFIVATLLFATDNFADPISKVIEIDHTPRLVLDSTHTAIFSEEVDLNPEEVPRIAPQHWHKISNKTITIGTHNTPLWFRFKLHNTTDLATTRVFEIRWNNFESLTVFELKQDQTPDQIALAKKGRDSSSRLYLIELEPGQSTELFMRLESQNQIFLPIFIWQTAAFDSSHAKLINWYFLAFGALLALTLYNLSLFIFTREKTYFYYTFYAISVIIYELGMTGIGSYYVWAQSEWMQKNGFALGVNLCFFSAAVFFKEFLYLKSYTKLITIAWYFIVGYWALGLLSLIYFGWFPSFALESSLFTCICAIIGTIWLLALGNISARYYAVAWGALVLFTMGTLLMIAGIVPYSELTEYSQMAGFLIEMLLLSIALAARINRERTQREMQQQNMLKLQMEITKERENKIQAQEHILRLEQEAKQQLEHRVQERTLELQQAMQNLKAVNTEMANLSVTDSLTSLHNRRYFDEVLEKEITRSNRSHQPVSLILIDIDHFKQFNDNYGHLVGDECLRTVALVLKNEVSRKSDLVARYGGEEFAVILPDTPCDQAFAFAESIRNTIQNLVFKHQGQQIPISASLGIATIIAGQSYTPNRLIELADSGLYQAKNQGRNRCVAAGGTRKQVT